jgi:hypothetical protein
MPSRTPGPALTAITILALLLAAFFAALLAGA